MQKCQWAKKSTKYLGHQIGGGKLIPAEAKTKAIKKFERPRTKREIRSFLGLAGYYLRFIPNFASVMAKISDLTRKDRLEQAFQTIKDCLKSEPILMNPVEGKPQTDASNRGIGAVLNQTDDDEVLRSAAYYSRKLLPREQKQKYAGTQLECLALVEAIKHFSIYLSGAQFHAQTDSRALTFVQKFKEQNRLLMRWALSLQEYSFTIEH